MLHEEQNNNSLESILEELHKMAGLLNGILHRKKYLWYIMRTDYYQDLMMYIDTTIQNILEMIIDIRSELSGEIVKQQKTLE